MHAEADSDRKCTRDHGDTGHVDTGNRQCHDDSNNEPKVADHSGYGIPAAAVAGDVLQPAAVNPALAPTGDNNDRRENEHRHDDVCGHDGDVADRDALGGLHVKLIEHRAGGVPDIDNDHQEPDP